VCPRSTSRTYVSRAGRKTGADTVEDLKKARWYLDRYIARLTSIPPVVEM
jgi:hypothetical protein